MRVLGSQCLLAHRQRPSVQRLSLVVLALPDVEQSQIVQRRCRVWVLRPQRLLVDRLVGMVGWKDHWLLPPVEHARPYKRLLATRAKVHPMSQKRIGGKG